MWTAAFWKDAVERAAKTAVQFVLVSGILDATNTINGDWVDAAKAAGLGALLSFVFSLGSAFVGSKDNASLVE